MARSSLVKDMGRKKRATKGEAGKNPFVRFNLKCPRPLWYQFLGTMPKAEGERNKTINEYLLDIFIERVSEFEKSTKKRKKG